MIGIRSRIGKDSVIRNTYMIGSNNYQNLDEINKDRSIGKPYVGVGERCVIENVIIDKDVRIGNDVVIQGGAYLEDTKTDGYIVKDGVVVIRRRTVIPDGFELKNTKPTQTELWTH